MFYKSKRIPKLGDSLKLNLQKRHFWKGIEASQVAKIFNELGQELKILRGTQMVSWREGILKIKVPGAVQRAEIILKQEKVKEGMKKKGVEVKELKIIF